jgi:amino acid adenylation domain-containing protein
MARVDRLLLHECFEDQAASTPDRVALYCKDSAATYADLKAASDRVAASLRARGIRKGCYVGLHMERSIEYVVAMLGILKANGAVVPLPPSYPEGRLREILSFAGLHAVIDAADTPLPPGLSDRVLRLSDLSPAPAAPESGDPGDPDQPAFVLCSSGSTGTPKMIVRSHRSFFHRLRWTWEHHPYAEGEVCCQKSFMTTTHAIYELFEPLLRGVPVVIISDQEARDLEAFWETIRARAVSRLLIVPSVLRASLDMPGFVAPSVKVLVLMGEYVPPRLAGRALESFPRETRLFSIYGSTEASSTLVCDLRESFRAGEELPLGKPIAPEVRAYVLGAELEPVGPGEVGMLHMAGPALFEEYFKDPALTASVLVSSPTHAGRLYDTRDQVRRMPDGTLQFVGRIDHTVKIRGFRVDLAEVERTLLLHPDVGQAAVLPSDDGSGSSMLLAFVTPGSVDRSSVYRLLRERLPGYMVPSVLLALDSLPLTPGGKLDRRRLLEEYAGRGAPGAPVRPLSETERSVAGVWAGVLKHGDIGLDRSFFEVGGTSLTVFAAIHRLREAFGLDRRQLTDQAIYQFPTLEQLASHIDGLKAGRAPVAAAADSILVTLKRGADPNLPPFFVVAPPGGTLGAYDRLAKALDTTRDIIGLRDPFVWGGRDPAMGFQTWVRLYVDAIRERQPVGPYYLGAYSSAGSFGYEIGQHLRRAGQEVALAALIDPLGIDSRDRRRFGYWAFRARYMRPALGRIVLLGGWLRLAGLAMLRGRGLWKGENDDVVTEEQFREMAAEAKRSRHHVRSFSALMELNTGLPFGLAESDLASAEPERYLGVLLARVKALAPDVEPESVENMVVQYYLQTRAQHRYRLGPYDGKVVIFEPEVPQNGLLFAQFKPYVRDLRVVRLRLGPQSERTEAVSTVFSRYIRPHYLSMRDAGFVRQLAAELGPLLTAPRSPGR